MSIYGNKATGDKSIKLVYPGQLLPVPVNFHISLDMLMYSKMGRLKGGALPPNNLQIWQ